ncbi:MAG: hypothetical protein HYS13_06180 [Planctomycetia bacterium]|nr:hypothetical protein [Planctomycetia bacterium]
MAVRRGITLLELILSLALTAIIVSIIGVAIFLNLRALDKRRADVEETQLARAVLRMMADDIKSAVQTPQIDTSQIESSGSAGASSGGGQGSGGGAGTPGGDSGSGGSGSGGSGGGGSGSGTSGTGATGAETETANNTEDIAGSTTLPAVVGLYGNQYELQVDTSRLPRVDQYDPAFTPSGTADIPSDVKTVAYFLRTTPISQEPGGRPGLVRRSLDRAVAEWSSDGGGLTSQYDGDLLAPEVTALEFRYFDGKEWLTEWDSQQLGGLPMAVEIVIVVDRTVLQQQPGLLAANPEITQGDTLSDPRLYRLVVQLPGAQPCQPASGETTTAATTTSQSSSGAASGATSGAGAGGSTP